MASDSIACRIVIQNEQLEQLDTYLGSLITADGECTTEFRNSSNRGQAIGASLQMVSVRQNSVPAQTVSVRKFCVRKFLCA